MLEFISFIRSVFALFTCISMFISTGSFVASVPHKEDFELVWADEFEGDTLDTDVWSGHYFNDGTAMRKGGYWNMDFATVKDGNLHISTKYYPDGYNGNGIAGWYTCAIDTQETFSQTYGYFEVRCILPKGAGAWSAFWLMPDQVANIDGSGKDGAEIDIYESPFFSESTSLSRNRVSSAIHFDGYGDAHQSKTVCKPYIFINNPYENYNTYGLEWNEDEYIFYVNGIETGRTSFGGTSQVDEWLILSVEIGGADGVATDSWAGNALTPDIQVTDFIVDYVRVYQYK